MVFSSLEFVYLFLVPVFAGFLVLRTLKLENGIIFWLIAGSLAFYAWWSVAHLALLLGSVTANYVVHLQLQRSRSRWLLTLGVAGNLALLAWFKYADFLIWNVAALAGVESSTLGIVLPLAISFFTFQQISFLHDTYIGKIERQDFKRYVLFVAFFPQLIAGPIVTQRDTIPQFRLAVFRSNLALNIAVGSTLFLIGLFKKIVLADGIAPVANAVFQAADAGQPIPTDAAWFGALAYTFQIYFDFSGYCDMALGLARLFGIRLPVNFNSPYKALSISEFWRRWHITLSRFLRDYLYIPLGGNRSGPFRRHMNLLATMLLGGLWHGAGWNFVVWGGLHGVYLITNHMWRGLKLPNSASSLFPAELAAAFSWLLTMTAVVVAWVFFRAETFSGAISMLQSMFMLNPVTVSGEAPLLVELEWWIFALTCLALICVLMPNSIELTRGYRPVLHTARELAGTLDVRSMRWRPTAGWGLAVGGIGAVAFVQVYRLNDLTEFIYFNF